MANWYYYSEHGGKVGPIPMESLKLLAQQGVITRETVLENPNGGSIVAGSMKELTFPTLLDTTPKLTVPPPDPEEFYRLLPPPLPTGVPPQLPPAPKPGTLAVFLSDVGRALAALRPKKARTRTRVRTVMLISLLMVLLWIGWERIVEKTVAEYHRIVALVKDDPEKTQLHAELERLRAEQQQQRQRNIPNPPEVQRQMGAVPHQRANTQPVNIQPVVPPFPALLEAAQRGTVNDVRYFLDRGTNVNAKDGIGETALHEAALRNSNVEVLKYLVSVRGIDINARDYRGRTPLDVANTEEKRVILRAAGGRSGGGSTAPSGGQATASPRPTGAQTVTRTTAPPQTTSARYPDIFAAARRGTPSDVQYFLDRRINVNIKNESGWTPLHEAAQSNSRVEVLRLLVSQGANVSVKNNGGWTPLHGAARHNPNVEILKYLVSQKADVNAKDRSGRTPLDVAAPGEKREILRAAGGKTGK